MLDLLRVHSHGNGETRQYQLDYKSLSMGVAHTSLTCLPFPPNHVRATAPVVELMANTIFPDFRLYFWFASGAGFLS